MNPYQAPYTASSNEQAVWHLNLACRILRNIGLIVIAYILLTSALFGLAFVRDRPEVADITVLDVVCMAFAYMGWGTISIFLILTVRNLSKHFDRVLYKRARWLAIITAIPAFPVLAIPVVIAFHFFKTHLRLVGDLRSNTRDGKAK